jgi:hypothetical protein
MRRVLPVLLALLMAAASHIGRTQAADDAGSKNANQARAALEAMEQALGGQAWLEMKNQMRAGHMAAFFQGKPSGGTTPYWEYHAWPDQDRIELTKHRDVVDFYLGRTGSEVTFRGSNPLPQDQVDEFLRRRDHSIETAVKVWLKDPKTILIYEGQRLAERHLADQVTLISAGNEAITILMDAQSHLPLRRSFQWRDAVYKDMNVDAEEYDDYHTVDGFATPISITRYKNGDMLLQYYLDRVADNQSLPPDFWNVEAVARRIRK